MAVRNVSRVSTNRNPRPIPIHHVIPPSSDADYLFEIETDTEIISLEDLIVKGRVTDGPTETIGDFELQILDPDRTIYEGISTYDELTMKADYGTVTNLRFRGKIERRGYQDIYLIISGRAIGLIFAEKKIIYNSNGNKNKSDVLKEIIAANFTGINVDNIVEDTTQANVNYFEIPFTEIISELCGSTHDFYLDHSYNAHYFLKGSRQSVTEAISEDANHIITEDNADDTEETYTKVRVYGSDINGLPIISSSESDTTLTKGVDKDFKVDFSSIVNSSQAGLASTSEFSKRNTKPKVGNHSSFFLPTLQPGEKLFIAIPREDIDPGHYLVDSYTHTFDLEAENDRMTTVNLVKRRLDTSKIIKNRINFENNISTNINPSDFDNTFIIDFKNDSGTHVTTYWEALNVDESGNSIEGEIKTTSGNESGTWVSNQITSSQQITRMQLQVAGENTAGILMFISTDDGNTYVQTNVTGGFTFPVGLLLRIKLEFTNSSQKVRSIALFYDF